MTDPIAAGLKRMQADPWGTMRSILDGPLHPGGTEATVSLLDRAVVDGGTRLLDLGCGAGEAVDVARERGAVAVGLDRAPDAEHAIRGDLSAVPVADAAVDVVISECTLCLAEDITQPLTEARRVLRSDGRLAISDMVVDGEMSDLPAPIERGLCLTGRPDREGFLDAIDDVGFDIDSVEGHRDDVLGMRDRIRERVDYEDLLAAIGGESLLKGVREVEAAIEDGRIGYVSVVAGASGDLSGQGPNNIT